MILCLDAGNSRLKYGLRDRDTWRAQGALEYPFFPQNLATALPAKPARIIACNVAGQAVQHDIAAYASACAIPLDWLQSSATACGVTNGYDSPTQLGADRWAALLGARSLHTDPCVVVMAGTATTVDALDGNGRFLGGLILPGLALMRTALARHTAGLPHAAGSYRPLPTCTDDAIVSGTLHATLGAIERIARQLGGTPTCLLSGGAAEELTLHLSLPVRRVKYLVLEGLARYGLRGA